MFTEGEIYYRRGVLTCEDVALPEIAETYGTPAYVYSTRAITKRFKAYQDALKDTPHQICFAVKSNSNLAVLQLLAKSGAGFDIVSGGELFRVISAGGDARKVVFSGVGKTDGEIRFALEKQIHSFNCESEDEVHRISQIASQLGVDAVVALRVNPDVDAATHPYISTGLRQHKFGVAIEDAPQIYGKLKRLPNIRLQGVSCHIGSQLLQMDPLLEAAAKILALVETLRQNGIGIHFLDLGGGIGVPYRPSDQTVAVSAFVGRLQAQVAGRDLTIMLEPGRSIVAEAGVLLSRVLLTKRNGQKTFVIVDAGMNDLIRPSLYQAHHEIVPVGQSDVTQSEVDIVGPVCETGDFFARGRAFPAVEAGELVAIQTAGAYGFVLSSNYNSRPRCCELLVDESRVHVARQRETFDDLIRGEKLPE